MNGAIQRLRAEVASHRKAWVVYRKAVVDCDHVLFAYVERHTQEAVRKLFGRFKGFLQSDASSVYDILDRGPPKDEDDDRFIKLVGCWAHYRRYFFEAAVCRY